MSDLSFQNNLSTVCTTCFYWLHQLVCRSATFSHYLVCWDISPPMPSWRLGLTTATLCWLERRNPPLTSCNLCLTLQSVLPRKFDRGLSLLLHSDQHWLNIPQRVQYKLGLSVHQCLQYKSPEYLIDCCKLVSDVVGRRHLRSVSRQQLFVSRHRLSTFDVGVLCWWSDGLERASTDPRGSFCILRWKLHYLRINVLSH